jgi:hypothetical protein
MATKLIYKSRKPFLEGVFGFFCGVNMAITISETEPLDFYAGYGKALIIKKKNRVLSVARISKSRGEFYG